MLGLTGTLNYYLFNGSIDMRKGVYGLVSTQLLLRLYIL